MTFRCRSWARVGLLINTNEWCIFFVFCIG
jgi:hypothetical protein